MAGNNTDEDEVPVMKAANTTSAPSVKDESDNDDDEDVEDIVMPIRKNTEKPSAPKKSAVLKNPFATSVKPATTVTPSLSPGEAAPYKQGQKRQLEGAFICKYLIIVKSAYLLLSPFLFLIIHFM